MMAVVALVSWFLFISWAFRSDEPDCPTLGEIVTRLFGRGND